MKKTVFHLILAVLCLCMPENLWANSKKTVTQVTSEVTISEDVDYIITSDTPFADDGSVDITNTEHAVLILQAVKPSKAIAMLSHVKINGARAVNNTNCQVKIYNRGCIIMPYANGFKPLTVFSEKNFTGEAVNDFGLENSGGFMNTLSAEKLNNRIQSFKLKRGYMVTFSTQPRGRGYSRCFIAADSDLEIAELPVILAGRISSYRIFKWYDTSKSGIANDTRSDPCAKLNVTSCYSFGLGEDRGMDTECVPHHIYEDWPSAAACGGVTYSPHMKTNNEPGNSADDHPQSVDEILANWENLMATGMRLCSPSSHDGSLNHLRAFMDSIDARGWRCDIIDLHCYWTEGSFNNIKGSWVDRYKRPIWISEWVWGASWNNNGIFGVATGTYRDNPTESQLNQNKNAIQNICSRLNSWDYIERYFYWNSEANCSKIYRDGKLTPAGEYYAGMNTGVGYNGRYEFVPTTPRQYGLSQYNCTIEGDNAIITWYDQNGEYNQLMEVQRKAKGGQWETIAEIQPKEAASKYTYTDENSPQGAVYRVHIIDLLGVDHYTFDDMDVGDAVTNAAGEKMFAGGNIIANGDFEMGMTEWNAGNGNAIALPYFQVPKAGGYDGGPYLQAYGNGGIDHSASLKKVIDLKPNQDYVFSVAARTPGSYLILSLTSNGTEETKQVAHLVNTADWRKQTFTFNSGEYSQALLAFRWLGGKAQIDKVELRPLYVSRTEAVAHGVEAVKKQSETVEAFNKDLPELNINLSQQMSGIAAQDEAALYEAQEAVSQTLQAINDKEAIDSMLVVYEAVKDMDFDGKQNLNDAVAAAKDAKTASEIIEAKTSLMTALNYFYTTSDATVQPLQPNFSTTNGWVVKAGTYTGGDQRINTVGGKTCWNAWWSGVSAAQGTRQSMEVKQTIDKVPEGLYSLECKATTQHYCISDQHGYMTVQGKTVNTPVLAYDYFDLPTIGNMWQTLTTTPMYVKEGESITIGFVGTKDGAVDNAWHPIGDPTNNGDKREGWWCATDFVLKYHPIHKRTAKPGEWYTVCLPYAYNVPEGMKCYKIAGILADHSKICIEKIQQVEAGKPCIYVADKENVTFYEYGDKVNSPLSYAGENNLRGFFETSAKAPKGSYVLTNGTWLLVGDDRPYIESYTAIIFKLDGMTELQSWDGLTMNISDNPDGINNVTVASKADGYYNLNGQPISKPNGVYIEVKGNKAVKVIKK